MQVQRPQTVLAFTRKESRSPLQKSLIYRGKVNARKIGIFDPGTLLCTRLDGDSPDNGATFTVRYEFQFNDQTWSQDISWIDPETDRPPPDVSKSNGRKTVELYEEADFFDLNLPFL